MLDSGLTPEEVCRDCPELVPEVKRRWRDFCQVDESLGAVFPGLRTPFAGGNIANLTPTTGLPLIPGYTVEEVLGFGGVGVVYKARQQALERVVAVKMLLAGPFASPLELGRFRRETAALACLKHSNIVQVYDAGDVDGRPFLAMELVEGGTLARKLADSRLQFRDAAELVATLAGAVDVAHQAGIVHRDLKPANILLAVDGTPKITDFGLARRLEGGEELTQTGVTVGTPNYMAPEQAGGQARAIGPAVDVYALGAILYEMLTGRPPFRGETPAETVRQVMEQDPVLPARLNPKVPRDLQTVCLKCLSKEPQRRYASAAALVDDLRRFLEGRPIVARPLSLAARLARWSLRNPMAVAIGVLLLVAATVSTWLAIRAMRAESNERLAKEDVQKRLVQVEKAVDLLPSVFERVDSRDMARTDGSLQAILITRLDQAAKQLESELTGDPLVVANLQEKFGRSLLTLGAPGKAVPVLERSRATREAILGAQDPQTLITMSHLGMAYQFSGRLDLALPLQEITLKLMQTKLGPDDPSTLGCRNNLYVTYELAGRLDLALPLQEETLRLMDNKVGPDGHDLLIAANNLAITYLKLGQLDRALPIFEETFKRRKAVFGPDDLQTLVSMNCLADAYAAVGQLDRALPLLEETLRRRKTALGVSHPDTLSTERDLEFYRNIATAQERYRTTLAKLGPDHIDTLLARRDVAQMYQSTNRLDEAEPILAEVIEQMSTRPADDQIRCVTIDMLYKNLTMREVKTPNSWLTFQTKSQLGGALLGLKRLAVAERLLLTGYEGMKKREATIPAQRRHCLTEAATRLVKLYEVMENNAEAAKWRKELNGLSRSDAVK
jgi:tetratricopeptide (TPR) repeat protein/tRNA A-37 threonylcarbamoyl transferase component Bud32